jgi:hypothetical protein
MGESLFKRCEDAWHGGTRQLLKHEKISTLSKASREGSAHKGKGEREQRSARTRFWKAVRFLTPERL